MHYQSVVRCSGGIARQERKSLCCAGGTAGQSGGGCMNRQNIGLARMFRCAATPTSGIEQSVSQVAQNSLRFVKPLSSVD